MDFISNYQFDNVFDVYKIQCIWRDIKRLMSKHVCRYQPLTVVNHLICSMLSWTSGEQPLDRTSVTVVCPVTGSKEIFTRRPSHVRKIDFGVPHRNTASVCRLFLLAIIINDTANVYFEEVNGCGFVFSPFHRLLKTVFSCQAWIRSASELRPTRGAI